MIGRTIDEIHTGDSAEFSKTISESDVYLFAGLTGDLNPVHINEHHAKQTFFKTRICHGMLCASFFSTVLGTIFPGAGTIYIRQEAEFLAPVHIGDTITARVTVEEKYVDRNRITLKTRCFRQDGELVIDGKAIVSPPKRSK